MEPDESARQLASVLGGLARCSFQVAAANYILWPSGRTIMMHSHDNLVHLDYFSGSGHVTLRDKTLPLRPATLLMIPPGIPHRFSSSPSSLMRNYTVKLQVVGMPPEAMPMIYLRKPDESLAQRVRDALSWIVEENQIRSDGYEFICDCLLRSLAAAVIRARMKLICPPPHGVLEEACGIMATEYSHQLEVRDVAHRCGIRPDSLSRLFRAHLKTSPRAYLQGIRLEQARSLLSGGYSVTHVAEITGFASVHYFSRAFARAFGIPPSKWGQTDLISSPLPKR